MELAAESNTVYVESGTIYFNVYIFDILSPLVTHFKLLVTFIYRHIF